MAPDSHVRKFVASSFVPGGAFRLDGHGPESRVPRISEILSHRGFRDDDSLLHYNHKREILKLPCRDKVWRTSKPVLKHTRGHEEGRKQA